MVAEEPVPPFVPRFPWFGPDLQTLRDFLVQPCEVVPSRCCKKQLFNMPDGSGDQLVGDLDLPLNGIEGRPLAVLIHGLTGCSDSFYIRRAARVLLSAGFPTLRLNLRGAGPSRKLCRFQYHSGRSEDLLAVLDALDAPAGMVLIGWSLGANMLVKSLAELGADNRVLGAVAISAPIDLAMTARRFLAWRNRPYHHWMLRRMKAEAVDGAAEITGDMRARIATARSVIEFDDVFTGPVNGFAGAEDYYARCSAVNFLADLRIPTLVIHARDDPWIPAAIYAGIDWDALPCVELLLPRAGGHVGFHGPGGVWSDARAVAFLNTLSPNGYPISAGVRPPRARNSLERRRRRPV